VKTGDKKHWLMGIILAVDALSGLRADEVPPAYRMIALEKDLPPSDTERQWKGPVFPFTQGGLACIAARPGQ